MRPPPCASSVKPIAGTPGLAAMSPSVPAFAISIPSSGTTTASACSFAIDEKAASNSPVRAPSRAAAARRVTLLRTQLQAKSSPRGHYLGSGHAPEVRKRFLDHLQPFRAKFRAEDGHSGEI